MRTHDDNDGDTAAQKASETRKKDSPKFNR